MTHSIECATSRLWLIKVAQQMSAIGDIRDDLRGMDSSDMYLIRRHMPQHLHLRPRKACGIDLPEAFHRFTISYTMTVL
jgi:hypothetical protein